MNDEPALIQAAQRGDRAAFNTLVLAYQALAYSVALRLLGDAQQAADATQEAFLSAFAGIKHFRGGSFRAWLLRTVTNACYDLLRQKKRRPTLSLEASPEEGEGALGEVLPAAGDTPDQAAERRALRQHLARCVLALPHDQRVVFVLVDVHGLSYDEAAQALSVPVGTVKSRLSRARARLRDALLAQPELLPETFRLKKAADE
ncbi:MAG: sigma-70 family RNA polymerase sigma factor [Thermoflexales bacterium]|nr:sigma-70 family RNA polymerase sigma factor [Thermoflexales bacterium]